MSATRLLRDLRHTLHNSTQEQFDHTLTKHFVPHSASASSLLVKSRPTSAAPSKEDFKADDATAIGQWVAQRLTELQTREEAALKKFSEGRTKALEDDPFKWGAGRVAEWLSVHAPPQLVGPLREQGLRGMELLALDEADLCALGCSLVDRKRLLTRLAQLRSQTSLAREAALKRQEPGGVTLGLHLSSRRERLGVLHDCFSKVLTHMPSVPLKTRRLLTVLFQQCEAVGLESLARIERDASSSLRRDEALAEKHRRAARERIEPVMAAEALAEDKLLECEILLELEKRKLAALRESVFAADLGLADKLKPTISPALSLPLADFEGQGVLGLDEQILKTSEELLEFIEETENDQGEATEMLNKNVDNLFRFQKQSMAFDIQAADERLRAHRASYGAPGVSAPSPSGAKGGDKGKKGSSKKLGGKDKDKSPAKGRGGRSSKDKDTGGGRASPSEQKDASDTEAAPSYTQPPNSVESTPRGRTTAAARRS